MRRLTTACFVQRAKEIHGDKYDYTKTVYVNARTSVLIKCNSCGKYFKQNVMSHLRGCGCSCQHLHKGRDKSRGRVCNRGVLDTPFSCTKDKITFKAYKIFGAMFRRCYHDTETKRKPAYYGCSVCKEWHSFSNFLAWFKENYIDGYALDKDILVKGNKTYSPQTCCFVPTEINSLLTNRKNHRNGVIGVHKTRNGTYQVHCNIWGKPKFLGTFETQKEAFLIYKKAKEAHIKEIAQTYFNENKITKKVYNALYNWTIEITD